MRLVLLGGGEPAARRVSAPTARRSGLIVGIVLAWALTVSGQDSAAAGGPATPSSGLTLDQVIGLCLANDPKIRSGLEGVAQARADVWTASLRPNPELSASRSFMPLNRPFTPEEPGGPTELAGGLSYPIDWFVFGKRSAAMASAKAGLRVSAAEYADLVRKRVLEAAVAFYDVLEAQALLDVARQDTENLVRAEQLTSKGVENGARAKVELNRVRLELLNTRRAERDARASVVRTKAALRALLGETSLAAEVKLAGSLDGPLTATPLGVQEALSAAVEHRPDILALRRKVDKACRDVVVERRRARPEVTPEVEVARQYQTPIGSPDALGWSAGIAVTLPLSDRNQGNRARAASAVRQINHDLQSALLELRAEIEQAVQALLTAQQNAVSVARDELRLAADVRDSIAKAYEVGGRPLIDLLDAQRNYRETYRTYVTSRADYWRSLHRYDSAIGKQVAR